MTPADGPRVELLAGERAIADTTGQVPHPYPVGGGAGWIATHPIAWRDGSAITYALALPEDDVLIGAVSLGINGAEQSAELGYWLGTPYWNRGYMTEAARALVAFGFEVVGLDRIQATHLTRNPASGRVMEKIGMAFEAIEPGAVLKWGVPEDIARRSSLRSAWEPGTQR
jgi:RimJ/RimL family protein N-acetyltransferase